MILHEKTAFWASRIIIHMGNAGLICEDLLPASKGEIKKAMVRVEKILKGQGKLDKKTRDTFEVGYIKLAEFVPASEAEKSQRLTRLLEQAGNFYAKELADRFLDLDIIQDNRG